MIVFPPLLSACVNPSCLIVRVEEEPPSLGNLLVLLLFPTDMLSPLLFDPPPTLPVGNESEVDDMCRNILFTHLGSIFKTSNNTFAVIFHKFLLLNIF